MKISNKISGIEEKNIFSCCVKNWEKPKSFDVQLHQNILGKTTPCDRISQNKKSCFFVESGLGWGSGRSGDEVIMGGPP